MKSFFALSLFLLLLQYRASADNCNVDITVWNETKVPLFADPAQLAAQGLQGSGYNSSRPTSLHFNTRNTMWLNGVEGKIVLHCDGGQACISYSNPAVGASHYFVSCSGNLQGYIKSIDSRFEPQMIEVVIKGGPYVPPPPNIIKLEYDGRGNGEISGYFTWSFKTGQPQARFLDAFSVSVYVPHRFREDATGSSFFHDMRGVFDYYGKENMTVTVRRVTNCQEEFNRSGMKRYLLHTACDTGYIYAYRISGFPTDVPLQLDIHSNPNVNWNMGSPGATRPPAPGCVFTGVLAPKANYVFNEGVGRFKNVIYYCIGVWIDPVTGERMGDNASEASRTIERVKARGVLTFTVPAMVRQEDISLQRESPRLRNERAERLKPGTQTTPAATAPRQLPRYKRHLNR